jgi:hypothetical protein
MVQIGEAVEPDMSVLVLDGAIGECIDLSLLSLVCRVLNRIATFRDQVKLPKLSHALSRRRPTLVPSS